MKTILVADPDESLAQALRDQLEESDYSIEWVQDGEQAKKVIANGAPALLILELFLPKIHGLTLLRQLADGADQIGVKILIVSNRAFLQDMRISRELGVADYLIKPIDSEDLSRKVRELLS